MIYLIFKVININWCFPSKQSKQYSKLFFAFSSNLFVLPVLVSHVSLVIFYERFEAILVSENFCPICISSAYLKWIATEKMCPYLSTSVACCISTTSWPLPGAQPEIFQGRGVFVKLGHFNKHFLKDLRK